MTTVHCTKCGQGRILATHEISRATWLACLRKLGWQPAPMVLCRGCACPMGYWAKHNCEMFKEKGWLDKLEDTRTFQLSLHPDHKTIINLWFDTL